MQRTVYVISDLHVGGGYGDATDALDRGFRILTRVNHLIRFLEHLRTQRESGRELELVINGDFVDFLAEADELGQFSAFHADAQVARARLAAIVARDHELFAAFARLVGAGARLTILLGNHDVELTLPLVRRFLLDVLDPTNTGRITYLFDGEAHVVGDALIEHGNRYDGFNVVDHDALRRLRSSQSRRLVDARATFDPPPGSRLVVEIMNQIKREYPFVDLLKPETEAVLPILLAFEPGFRRHALKLARLYLASIRRGSEGATPKYEGDIAATHGDALFDVLATTMPAADARDFLSAIEAPLEQDIASGASSLGLVRLILARNERGIADRLPAVWRALRALERDRTFELETETCSAYVEAARALAAGGFRYVVFGHSHLAKRVDLGDGRTYFNTGTWADLIRFPSELLAGPDAKIPSALAEFITDLAERRYSRWLVFRPTYVRMEVLGDVVEHAELAFYEPPP